MICDQLSCLLLLEARVIPAQAHPSPPSEYCTYNIYLASNSSFNIMAAIQQRVLNWLYSVLTSVCNFANGV